MTDKWDGGRDGCGQRAECAEERREEYTRREEEEKGRVQEGGRRWKRREASVRRRRSGFHDVPHASEAAKFGGDWFWGRLVQPRVDVIEAVAVVFDLGVVSGQISERAVPRGQRRLSLPEARQRRRKRKIKQKELNSKQEAKKPEEQW